MKVNVFDNAFAHSKEQAGHLTMTYKYKPQKMEWVEKMMEWDGITVFTEDYIFNPIVDRVKSRVKIALLIEPPAIHPFTYENIVSVENKFDYILTYDDNLLVRGPKYLGYIVGQSRIVDDDVKIWDKSKKISMIASNKMMSDGHRYRHDIIRALHPKHQFELWGSGYRPFGEKIEPLKDFEFSIAVMNSKMDNFFTEVLLDCFRVGTVPIFWGCPNIGDYFNTEGMIIFNSIEELDAILNNLPPYGVFEKGIKENFELCKKYIHTDDYIAEVIKGL